MNMYAKEMTQTSAKHIRHWLHTRKQTDRRISRSAIMLHLSIMMPFVVFVVHSWFNNSVIGNEESCVYWVAPAPLGDDSNSGTAEQPWATIEYAAETIPDSTCTIWVENGLYEGSHRINRRFETQTTIQAINPYQVILESNETVISISGATNVILEGFIFQHIDSNAEPIVVYIDGSRDGMAEDIILRNNIFRNAYNNDLLKILDGVRFTTIENNVFYNQGPNDDHIDVNSVTDITIQDNIFFNDFAGSNMPDPGDTKAFITVKDSNENSDGLLGSERVTIRRNVFLNWQGGSEPFLQIGNDGKPYHEAEDIWIENNLMIGNSADDVNTVIALAGVKNVYITNNTIVGDMPARAYALRIESKGENPLNENIFFYNNIWSDPTGTMGAGPSNSENEFSDGHPEDNINLLVDNNLYWNGDEPIPPGEVVSPLLDDAGRILADPLLNTDQSEVVLPRWTGAAFLSGNLTIREEFVRLVMLYGQIPAGSPAVDQANAEFAPADDILGHIRSSMPDLGAHEFEPVQLTPTPSVTPKTAVPTPSETPTSTMPTETPVPTMSTKTPVPTLSPVPCTTPTTRRLYIPLISFPW